MGIIGTSQHLTIASKEDHLANGTHAGQAHWAVNSGRQCKDCKHFKRANAKKGSCLKAIKLSCGKVNQAFPVNASACKYFVEK